MMNPNIMTTFEQFKALQQQVNVIQTISNSKALLDFVSLHCKIRCIESKAQRHNKDFIKALIWLNRYDDAIDFMFYGIVPRAHKEAVVSEVAKTNHCPYCISAHTLMMQASGEEDASKIVLNNNGNVNDPLLQQRIEWGAATRTPDAPILKNPPFTVEEAPEIIGGALAFHYINRMVNIFIKGDMKAKPSP